MKTSVTFICELFNWAANPKPIRQRVARGERISFTFLGKPIPQMSFSALFRKKRWPDLRKKPGVRAIIYYRHRPMGFICQPSAASLKEHPTLRFELRVVDASMTRTKRRKSKMS